LDSHPLLGIKLLDLSPEPAGSPCAMALCRWGADRLALPQGLNLAHSEGMRILLLLVQEADVLICPPGASMELDRSLLHEYNPMLIVCDLAEGADPWAASSAILAALMHRSRMGLGQHVRVDAGGLPQFSAFDTREVPAPDPDRVLGRLGYDAEAIFSLRREGILPAR